MHVQAKYSVCTYHETVFLQSVRLRERQAVNRISELEATYLCELGSSVTSGFRSDEGEICSLLGYYTQRMVVIPYRRFGTTCQLSVNKSKKSFKIRQIVGVREQSKKKNWWVH